MNMKICKYAQLMAAISTMAAVFSTSIQAATYGNGVRRYTTGSVAAPTVYPTIYNVSTKTGAAIQTAINSANAAGGGTVVLASGTYWISSPITLRARVKIMGAGKTTTILKRLSSWTPVEGQSIFIAQNAALNNFYISDLSIDGNYTTAQLVADLPPLCGFILGSSDVSLYSYNLRFQNLSILHCAMGIVGGGGRDYRIESCDIYENGMSGLHHNVYFRRLGPTYIYKSNLNGSVRGTGFKVWGATYATAVESTNLLVNYCDISDNYKNNMETNGFGYSYVHHNTLDNQLITANDYNAGAMLGQASGIGCNNYDLINNKMQSNAKYGIRTEFPNGVNIQGNYSSGNGVANYNMTDVVSVTCDYNTSL